MAQHGPSTGGANVEQPVRILAEHRDQIPLTLVIRHDERKREHSAGAAAGHFQRHEMLRQQPGRVDDSPAPVEQSCKAVGTATRVHPSLGLRQQAARGEVVSLPGISHLALLLLAPQLPGAHPP
jgi:hypothetical protein